MYVIEDMDGHLSPHIITKGKIGRMVTQCQKILCYMMGIPTFWNTINMLAQKMLTTGFIIKRRTTFTELTIVKKYI